jgi:ABC-type lipoprotein export system ATPase subunit
MSNRLLPEGQKNSHLPNSGIDTNQISQLVSASKTFEEGGSIVRAVDKASFSICRGELVGITGPTGSGKTTLLNLIGMLESPSAGEVFFEGSSVKQLSEAERRQLRLKKIGFVFQQLRLMRSLSVIENIELPIALLSKPRDLQRERALHLIRSVGLETKEHRRPDMLSVGEQQMAAIARALANNPILILADEPTSHLDSASGDRIINLLDQLRKSLNVAVVVSTHDPNIGARMDRVYKMRDGLLAIG